MAMALALGKIEYIVSKRLKYLEESLTPPPAPSNFTSEGYSVCSPVPFVFIFFRNASIFECSPFSMVPCQPKNNAGGCKEEKTWFGVLRIAVREAQIRVTREEVSGEERESGL